MAERERFVTRWARLKAEQQEPKPDDTTAPGLPHPPAQGLPAATSVAPEAPRDDERSDAELLAEHGLPDIDSLTEDSDFTGFMKADVPERLRNLALRKLWRSNPVFANLDGMNEYDEDYSQVVEIVGSITNYRPGQGYIDEEPPSEDATEMEAEAVTGEAEASEEAGQEEAPPDAETAAADAATDETEPMAENGEAAGKRGPKDGA